MAVQRLHAENDLAQFARAIKNNIQAGTVIGLSGDLGAGKTTFARYLIRALCDNETLVVPSPTYTLLETYETQAGEQIWHYDAYRLEAPQDIYNTGFEDALAFRAIMLIEWPEKLGQLLPKQSIMLRFSSDKNGTRQVEHPW